MKTPPRSDEKMILEDLVRLESHCVDHPAGGEIRVLKQRHALHIAKTCACSVRQVYESALGLGTYPYCYIRNREALPPAGQLDLIRSRVAMVGAGGLGGQVILLLARMGIGYLTVVDHDVFDETNLNRQALCTGKTLGKAKAGEAAKVIASINPGVDVTPHRIRLEESNASELLAGSDVVVDALDNVRGRFILEKESKRLGIPLIHGAVAGFEGRVMTIFPEDDGMALLYGRDEPTDNGTLTPEAILGVPTLTPALIATLQAMEVLNVILKKKKISRNTMFHMDLERAEFNKFSFEE